jgi:polyphosphate kinase 2 (PPK2 family)
VLRETSTGAAPWTVVEGSDDRYRDITVGKLVLDALQATAKGRSGVKSVAAPVAPAAIDNTKLLRDLDLAQRMSVKAYDREMLRNQRALAKLTRTKWFAKRGLVLVFEGVDAAGKGGAVRRVTSALDVRQYTIIPIAAPTDEERAHPYLWRFWRRIPPRGGITVFDRSWYGRVLVERVEGYCSEADWLRAYEEINRFEEDLARTGVIVVKFWLHISRKEQLARFRLRQKTSFKRFKITADDWRNRKQWPAYEHAIADMIDRTSTEIAPWTLIEAEDKRFARVKVIRTIVERLGARRKRVS